MAWISVHTGIDGPKLRDLRKKLKCSKFEAIGILIYLWFWGLENAEKDGHILHADKEDIQECFGGAGAGSKIPTDMIVEALIETGWIDNVSDEYYIHDWATWQEQWYKAKERRESDAKRKRESRKNPSASVKRQSEDNPADCPTDKNNNTDDKVTQKPPASDNSKYSKDFEDFWNAYPRKIGKAEAYKKYQTRRKDGYSERELLLSAKNYALQCTRLRTEPQYIKHPKTFLSDSTPFADYIPKDEEADSAESTDVSINPFDAWKGES